MAVIAPASAAQALDAVRAAVADRRSLELVGGGTRRGLGRRVAADDLLDLSGLSGIVLYQPDELVLTLRPGTPLAEVADALARQGQHLAFEPSISGTTGGAVCVNASGPRRFRAGAARDFMLGVAGVSGHGEAFRAGGRVVKNVTGYDLSRLMAGSFGTLAVLTELTLKVLPRAAGSATLAIRDQDARAACAILRRAAEDRLEPSGAAWLSQSAAATAGLGEPGRGVALIRFEGGAETVRIRADEFARALGGGGSVLDPELATALWAAVGDAPGLLGAIGDDEVLWRLAVPPSAAAEAAALGHSVVDWAGGLVWVVLPVGREPPEIGSAMLHTASEAERRRRPLFREEAGVDALSRRVKRAFDPMNLLNPGRMREEVR